MPRRHTMTKKEWVEFEAAFQLMRALATGDTKRARELRRALAAPPKGGKNRFEVQYICCGKEDGVQEYATWEDAHAAREAYLTLNAHESHNRSAIIRDIPRNQQAPASGGEK